MKWIKAWNGTIRLKAKKHGTDLALVNGKYLVTGKFCGDGSFVPYKKVKIPVWVRNLLMEMATDVPEEGYFNSSLWRKFKELNGREFLEPVLSEGEMKLEGHTCCWTRQYGCAYLGTCKATAPKGGVVLQW